MPFVSSKETFTRLRGSSKVLLAYKKAASVAEGHFEFLFRRCRGWRRCRRCWRDVMIRREAVQFEFGTGGALAGSVAGNSRSAAFGFMIQSGRLKLKLAQIQLGRAFGKMEKLHADHLIAVIEIQHDARRYFFRFDDFGFIEPEIKRVRCLVHMQSHSLPFI
jgi:hypothetical protein